jgi:hypothetical protein
MANGDQWYNYDGDLWKWTTSDPWIPVMTTGTFTVDTSTLAGNRRTTTTTKEERGPMIPSTAVLTVPPEEAEHQLALYADLPELTEREKNMLAIYDAVLAGEKIIKLNQVLQLGMAMEGRGFPKVAIAPVEAEMVTFLRDRKVPTRRPRFDQRDDGQSKFLSGKWSYPLAEWDWQRTSFTEARAEAMVPLVPPTHRDKIQPGDLMLWEPVWLRQNEKVIDPDPAIIRPLSNGLYQVVAAWDLTSVEAMMLSD